MNNTPPCEAISLAYTTLRNHVITIHHHEKISHWYMHHREGNHLIVMYHREKPSPWHAPP